MKLFEFYAFEGAVKDRAEVVGARVPKYNSSGALDTDDAQWQDTSPGAFGRNWIQDEFENESHPVQVKLRMLGEPDVKLATPLPKETGWIDVENALQAIDDYYHPKADTPARAKADGGKTTPSS